MVITGIMNGNGKGAPFSIGLALLVYTLLAGCSRAGTTQSSNTTNGTNSNCPTPSSCLAQPMIPQVSMQVIHRTVFTPGANATYVIRFSAAAVLTTVTVRDIMPAGSPISFVSASSPGWNCSPSDPLELACTNPGPIPPALLSTDSMDIVVEVAVVAKSSGTLLHIIAASGSAQQVGGFYGSAPDTIQIGQTPVIDLAVSMSHGPLAFVQGLTGGYGVTVTNVGNVTSGPATITDNLPAGLTFLSGFGTGANATWSCTGENNGHTATCTAPSVDPGTFFGFVGVSLDVAIDANAPVGLISNTAQVVTAGDSNTANDSSTDSTAAVIPPGIDLAINQVILGANSDGTLLTGHNLSLQMEMTNAGTAATSGTITFSDNFPTGFHIISVGDLIDSPNWTCNTAFQLVTCTNSGPLNPARTVSIPVAFTIDPSLSGTTVSNTATVSTPGDVFAGDDSLTSNFVIK